MSYSLKAFLACMWFGILWGLPFALDAAPLWTWFAWAVGMVLTLQYIDAIDAWVNKDAP